MRIRGYRRKKRKKEENKLIGSRTQTLPRRILIQKDTSSQVTYNELHYGGYHIISTALVPRYGTTHINIFPILKRDSAEKNGNLFFKRSLNVFE